MIRTLLLALIRTYQAYLSPYKGFRCAHAVVHGGASCSTAVAGIIEADGPWRGRQRIKMRFTECRQAAEFVHRRPPSFSRGALECDYGLSSCDGSVDASSCFDGLFKTDKTGSSTFASADCCVNACDLGLTRRQWPRLVLILVGALCAWFAYDHGTTVESVVVTLEARVSDNEPGLIDRLLPEREARYHLILGTRDGKRLTSDIMTGDLAQGIVFQPPANRRIGQIQTVTLKRKKTLKDETLFRTTLDASDAGPRNYRVAIQTKWSFFARVIDQ